LSRSVLCARLSRVDNDHTPDDPWYVAPTSEANTHIVSTQFVVEGTFVLRSRSLFIAHGNIVAGRVKAGQRPLAPMELDAVVDAVEFLLRSAGDGREGVALCFRYRDEDQLARWQDLELAGQTIHLEDVGAT
jgi:hypothetical protein